MTTPVVRDVDIVTNARTTSTTAATQVETATATAGNQTFTVLNSATTAGAALPGAVTAAGAGSTVILSGTFNTNAQVFMSVGQTIIGSGSLTVRSASGRTATLNLPGATIAATGNSTLSALSMANNSTLTGMTIINPYAAASGNSVDAQSKTGVTITNNVITVGGANGGYAVDALSTTNAVISGNTINAVSTGGASAIGIRTAAGGNVTIAGNTFSMTATTRYAVTGSNLTSFNAASSGNVTNGGSCLFVGGAPTGSVGFSTITCP